MENKIEPTLIWCVYIYTIWGFCVKVLPDTPTPPLNPKPLTLLIGDLKFTRFRASGLGFRVQGFGFRIFVLRFARPGPPLLPLVSPDGVGLKIQGLRFRIQGLGFEIHDLAFRIQGLGFGA